MEMLHESTLSDGEKRTEITDGLIKFSSLMNDSRIVYPMDSALAVGDAERIIGRSEFAHISKWYLASDKLMIISRKQLKLKIGTWHNGLFEKTRIDVENMGKLDIETFYLESGVEVNVGGIFKCRFTYFDGRFVDGVHPHGDILSGIPHKINWISTEEN